eukprot:336278-Chlamydomonas_euryale.AAC.3
MARYSAGLWGSHGCDSIKIVGWGCHNTRLLETAAVRRVPASLLCRIERMRFIIISQTGVDVGLAIPRLLEGSTCLQPGWGQTDCRREAGLYPLYAVHLPTAAS